MLELGQHCANAVNGKSAEVQTDGAISGTVSAMAGFPRSYEYELLQSLSGRAELFVMELIPTSETIGEPVDEALGNPSEFR